MPLYSYQQAMVLGNQLRFVNFFTGDYNTKDTILLKIVKGMSLNCGITMYRSCLLLNAKTFILMSCNRTKLAQPSL